MKKSLVPTVFTYYLLADSFAVAYEFVNLRALHMICDFLFFDGGL